MSPFVPRFVRASLACLVLVGLVACDDPVQVGGSASPNGGRRRPGAAAGRGPAVADAGVDGAVDAGVVYVDNDFVEVGVSNRDPFRDFVLVAGAEASVGEILEVKLRNVALDQMRLIAVITGVPVPYAMIVDPDGVGHVVVRGDYIGRQELVNAGGAEGLPIALYWRIDRIRDGEVVLTRADPLNPDQPPLMRSMALRDINSDGTEGVRNGAIGNTGENAGSASDTNAPAPTPGAIVPPATRPRSSTRPNPSPAPAADGPPAPTGTAPQYPPQPAPAPTAPTRPPSIFGSGISR